MFCHNCGSIIEDNSTSCRHCGVAVTPSTSAATAPAEPASPPAAEAKDEQRGSYCRHCGTQNAVGANHCSACGTSLAASAPAGGSPTQMVSENDPSRSIGRSWLAALLLALVCFPTGINGLHRFYTGHIAIGIIQLVTLGGCFIWSIIDIVLIATDSFRDAEGRPLVKN